MNVKTITGIVAVAGLLLIATPAQHAQAASLINPGIAAAVQDGSIVGNTTEVRWHRGWRRHHGWHRRWHHRRHWRRW
jgi:hypothetical protein